MSTRNQSFLLQYVGAICASLGGMFIGTTLSFTAPVGPLLTAENATIHLTGGQLSWFTSSLNIGGLVGAMVNSYLMTTFGRRGTLLIFGVPAISSWILMAFSQNFTMLLIARLIQGVGTGIAMAVVPAYIGEISAPKIRGRLGCTFIVMLTLGLLYVSVVGALIKDIRWISLICLAIPVLLVCTMFFLPESPVFLVSKGRSGEAAKVLQKLNGANYDISIELESLKKMTKDHTLKGDSSMHKLALLIKPSGLKPVFLIVLLYGFCQFSGINGMLFNLNFIFQAAGTNFSADVSSIIFVFLDMVGSIFGAFVVDRVGRRILLIVSSIGNTVTLGLLGVFFYIKDIDDSWETWTLDNLFWLPLLCMSVYVLTFVVGIGSIPFVLCGEVFRSELQDISSSIASFAFWMFGFIVTLTFFPLKNTVGDHGLYWFYSSCCFVCFFFTYFCVPETKGKTREEIVKIYLKETPYRKTDTIL